MVLSDLLTAFGEAQAGRPFALDRNGVCRLGFHKGRELVVEPVEGSDKVHLYAALAPLPARNSATVYGKLLAANLFGEATGDAWFAIDPATEEIVLNRSFTTTHLDEEAFTALVTGFMDIVELWKRELDGPDFDELTADEDEPPQKQPSRLGDTMLIIRG
jgi:hypothetical protein